jgi:hypothetical protein
MKFKKKQELKCFLSTELNVTKYCDYVLTFEVINLGSNV